MKRVVIGLVIAILIVASVVGILFYNGKKRNEAQESNESANVEEYYGNRGNISQVEKVKFLSKNDEYLVGLILNDDKLDSKQIYERLLAYRDVLFESGKQDKENIQIEYDLRNTSIISRIMGKCKYSSNFVTDLKEVTEEMYSDYFPKGFMLFTLSKERPYIGINIDNVKS